MDIKELTQKALRIRHLYAEQNAAAGRKQDTAHEVIMEFVSDLGDLSRYITQGDRDGKVFDKKEQISRELAECLGHILVLAQEYDIDLEEAFAKESGRVVETLS
jgi:NTP pyrophosphatase (non-canonical NTP hydrolase)